MQNAAETDVDCGGGQCLACANAKRCNVGSDCLSKVCKSGVCVAAGPSCSNKVRDEDESDVDCGGTSCPKCSYGRKCTVASDCETGFCDEDGTCGVPLSVTALSPTLGPTVGGTLVTLTGTGFKASTKVTVDGVPGLNVTLVSSTTVTFWTPAAAKPAIVDVVVKQGSQTVQLPKSFRYFWTTLGFKPATSINLPGYAFSVWAGDLDGDKLVDVVTTDQITGTIGVHLGNGDGTFKVRKDFPANAGANGLAVADFNGDAKLDVAVTNYGVGTMSVLLGNGAGSFGAPQSYPMGNNVVGSVVASDLNGDGKMDLAVCRLLGVVTLEGNGDGTFKPLVAYPDSGAYGVVARDLDGDGKSDLVVTNVSTPGLRFFANDGAGGLKLPVTFGAAVLAFNAVVADFDGDGKLDVMASAGGKFVFLSSGLGNGTFAAAKTITAGAGGVDGLATSDLNRDGIADLVVSQIKGAAVNLGVGDGTFTLGATTAFASGNVTIHTLAIADLDGDGIDDVIAGGDSLFVARGTAQ